MDEILEPMQEGGPEPLQISFTLTGEEVFAAIRAAQNKRSFVIKTIQTVVLAIVFLLYAQAVVVSPTYIMGIMMCALSLFVLAAVWFVPFVQAKNAAKKSAQKELGFEITFCDTEFVVKEAQSENKLAYDFDTEAIETTALILLIVRKTKLFCIPKRAITPQEQAAVIALLQSKLESRYRVK